jgi:hypothetical protein
MVPLMSVTRNFFLGREPILGRGPGAMSHSPTGAPIPR